MIRAVRKVHGKVLITWVQAGIDCAIEKEQCGFRQGRGCMDQLFAVRQMCKNYLANTKDVFYSFMDREVLEVCKWSNVCGTKW